MEPDAVSQPFLPLLRALWPGSGVKGRARAGAAGASLFYAQGKGGSEGRPDLPKFTPLAQGLPPAGRSRLSVFS